MTCDPNCSQTVKVDMFKKAQIFVEDFKAPEELKNFKALSSLCNVELHWNLKDTSFINNYVIE